MLYFKIGTYAGTLDKLTLLLGGTVGFLFGGWTQLLTALLVLHLLDMITGMMVGGKLRQISSSRMFMGVKKKMGGWIALILANVIDNVLFDGQPIAVTGLAFVLISNEGLSITENLGNLGVEIPPIITDYLEQIRTQNDTFEINSEDVPKPEIEKVILEDEEGRIQQIENKKEEES